MSASRCFAANASSPPVARATGPTVRRSGSARAPSAHAFGAIGVGAPDGAKISAGGSGKVTFTYVPETSDKSTKIVFVQVMKELLDGKALKPSEVEAAFSWQDADTTSSKYHVDFVQGEKDPYYNGDDSGDVGTQGNAVTKTNASSWDEPHKNDGTFPAGTSKVRWEFRTSAFSAAGSDAGTWYGFVDWTYEQEKNKAGATKVGGTGSGSPGAVYIEAIDLWNKNHAFKMPKPSP